MPYITNKNKLEFARKLRRYMTIQERVLWYTYLRYHRFKWRKQHVIEPFIVDFYCEKLKLVIELDGGQHYNYDDEEYDKRRTAFLKRQGLRVIRFDNQMIDESIDTTTRLIEDEINKILNKGLS